MKTLPLPNFVTDARVVGVTDDFFCIVTADVWTTLVADSTVTVAAAGTNGLLTLTADNTDNNEVAVFTTAKLFQIADDKPHWFRCIAKLTEGNTDDANVFLGFSTVFGANLLVDNGAGPATTQDGVAFFKTDSAAGNVWNIMVANSTGSQTQLKVALTAANSLDKAAHAIVSGTQQTFEIEIQPKTSTTCDIVFKIDGIIVYKVTDWVFTSSAGMYAGHYVKAGGSNAEVLVVDRTDAWKIR